MPSKKPREPKETPIEEVVVRLQPIMGIPPRRYVPAVWVFLLLVALFFILVYPGIRNNGSLIRVASAPDGASVLVDGVRVGATPGRFFVKKGNREITIRKPGFRTSRTNLAVRGRVFGSLIVPRRDAIFVGLRTDNPDQVNGLAIREFGAWSRMGDPLSRYPVPAILTEGTRDAVYGSPGTPETATRFLHASLPMLTGSHHLADFSRSLFISSGAGAPPDAAGLLRAAADLSRIVDAYPDIDGAVASILTSTERAVLGTDAWADEYQAREAAVLVRFESKSAGGPAGTPPTRSYGGITFAAIAGGEKVLGDAEIVLSGGEIRNGARPRIVEVESFYMMTREVSMADWSRFVDDRPSWAPSNREELIASGLVSSEYLADWTSDVASTDRSSYPVSRVSWHAARAFAAWFSESYLEGTGLVADLPNEEQWEFAARRDGVSERLSAGTDGPIPVFETPRGVAGLRGMNGNLWEWCRNPYRENEAWFAGAAGGDGVAAAPEIDDPLAAADRPVRGGSFADRDTSWPASLRGSLPPEWCSPVVGIRLVLIPAG